MKKYIDASLIGAFFASVYPIIIALFEGDGFVVLTPRGNGIGYVSLQLILSMSIGIVAILLGKISFDNGKYSLLKSTIIHLVGLLLYVMVVGYICKWFVNFTGTISVVAGFIVIYTVLYSVSYLSVKKEVKSTNEAIKKSE